MNVPGVAPKSKPLRIANRANSLPTVRITERLLQDITQKAVEHFPIQKLILFGSRAWGKPRNDSDIDLLVIMRSRLRPMERAINFRKVCQPKFVPMDILVRTPEELRQRMKLRDPFFLEVLRHGRILYEKKPSRRRVVGQSKV